jgi:hypothetical protein
MQTASEMSQWLTQQRIEHARDIELQHPDPVLRGDLIPLDTPAGREGAHAKHTRLWKAHHHMPPRFHAATSDQHVPRHINAREFSPRKDLCGKRAHITITTSTFAGEHTATVAFPAFCLHLNYHNPWRGLLTHILPSILYLGLGRSPKYRAMEGNIGGFSGIYGNVDTVGCEGGDMLDTREPNVFLWKFQVYVCVRERERGRDRQEEREKI